MLLILGKLLLTSQAAYYRYMCWFVLNAVHHNDTSDQWHSHTRTYHGQVFVSFKWKHTPNSLHCRHSLDIFKHFHAHYLTNMGGCNPNDTSHATCRYYRSPWTHSSITANLLP